MILMIPFIVNHAGPTIYVQGGWRFESDTAPLEKAYTYSRPMGKPSFTKKKKQFQGNTDVMGGGGEKAPRKEVSMHA